MKKIFLIAVMLTVFSQTMAQKDYEKSNMIAIVQSPGSYDDGFSFAIQYEYQNPIVYVGAEVYVFPKLNNLDYAHFIARFGLNHRFLGKIDPLIRIHAGPRIGFIARETAGSGTLVLLGLEAGFDVNITDSLFIGLSAASDMKTDSKPIWGEDKHTVNSGLVRVGFRF